MHGYVRESDSANFHRGDGHVCRRHHTHSTEGSTTFGASERFLSQSLNYRLAVDLVVACFGSPSLAPSVCHLVFHPLFSYSLMKSERRVSVCILQWP